MSITVQQHRIGEQLQCRFHVGTICSMPHAPADRQRAVGVPAGEGTFNALHCTIGMHAVHAASGHATRLCRSMQRGGTGHRRVPASTIVIVACGLLPAHRAHHSGGKVYQGA